MTQVELVSLISKDTGIDRKTVNKVFNSTFNIIKKQILFGVIVKIQGFCTFKKDRMKPRVFRLPDGTKIKKDKRYTVKANISREFLKEVSDQPIY